MRALVTGACGFAGSHLSEHLIACGDQVVGTVAPGESIDNLSGVSDHITLYEIDIRDRSKCRELIKEHQPEVVFHLAGVAFLPDADADQDKLFAINVNGSLNLANSVMEHSPNARFIYISSAEVYGKLSPDCIPAVESCPVNPANPYAESKAASEKQLRQYDGLDLVILRPFTHIGPRQSPKFAASGFARQIANIEKGSAPKVIKVGNLKARRDIIDVKDMVRAYRLAAGIENHSGPFNIGSGDAVTIEHLLELLINISGDDIPVEIDPARLRAVDIPIYAGSPAAFSEQTGWEPKISLDRTLADMLNYWRNRV